MHRNLRFLAGGLASIAVASGVTLAGPSAYAADGADGVDRACGQPAVPAVFVTVITEPVSRVVPAMTHEEWLWQHEVTTTEHQYSRVITPAQTVTDWVRPGTVEHLWSLKVIDRRAADAVPPTDEQGHYTTVVVTPAVTVTLFEYVQQQTGKTRWEDAGWNAEKADGDKGQGWTRTGATREDVVTEAVTEQVWVVDQEATPGTPAVTELSHQVQQWSADSPGEDWSGPLDTRVVGDGTTSTVGDDLPSGAGWTKSGSHEVPAVVDTLWAEDAPDGYDATGLSRENVATEQTSDHSITAPGDGWTQVPGSRILVVDQPETTEVTPGTIRQDQISAELPATPVCSAVAPVIDPAVSPVADSESAGHSAVQAAHATHHAGSHTAAAAAGAATVLPEAGNPVSPLLLTAGLGALLAGGVLVGVGRRRLAD